MTGNLLAAYARNITSQFGEDGIIAEILARISPRNRTCVEFGAWDGKYLSNTWDLWHNQGWRAILIEGDAERHRTLQASLDAFPDVTSVCAFVRADGENSLDRILARLGAPEDIDVLSIDIDGDEYHVWHHLTKFRPRAVVVEYNPTIPPELDLVQLPGGYFGASAKALTRLANEKGYGLAYCTETNCIFVARADFGALGIAEPTLEEIFPRGNLSYVVNAYDGTMFLTKNPTYSPPIPLMSASQLGTELRRALWQESGPTRRAELPPGTLMPIKIFVLPEGVTGRSVWRQGVSWAWVQLKRTAVGKRCNAIVDRWQQRGVDREQIKKWVDAGRPAPPPHVVKQGILRQYAKRYGTPILVETGTYLGEMVEAMRHRFESVVSIELSPDLYRSACERFAGIRNVRIVHGDSATVLSAVLAGIDRAALFWLDGHFSAGVTARGAKETPILSEIDVICRHPIKQHVILVDDARCFDGTHDYPTLADLERFVRERRPDASFEVKDDIIRIT